MKIRLLIMIIILLFMNGTASAFHPAGLEEKKGSNDIDWIMKTSRFAEETEQFLKAKDLVFKNEWFTARTRLNEYLEAYPSGNYRDEALYWLAYSLNKIAVHEVARENVVSYLEEATHYLRMLHKQYPESLWKDDAHKLSSEITVVLDLLQNTRLKDLEDISLDALKNLEPEVAVSVFEDIMGSCPDPEIRKESVRLLGLYYFSRARELLEKTARFDEDKGVREEAACAIQGADLDARLKYHVYGCRLLDDQFYTEYPEGKIKAIDLQVEQSGNIVELLASVHKLFKGGIGHISRSAQGQLASIRHFDTNTKLMNRAGDYYLWIVPHKLYLSQDEVRGEVQFRHIETGSIETANFLLKEGDQKLIVLRSSDRLSLLILQFAYVKPEVDVPSSLEIISRQTLKTRFPDLMGWEILSSKESWTEDDLTGKTGTYDFGKAEALSKSPQGWKLIGNLSLNRRERRLIGRQAELIDSMGRTVAAGDEIVVPIDNPSRFSVTGSRRIKKPVLGLPDHGRLDVKGHFTLKPGLKIETALEYFKVADFEKNLVNFEQSRAILPEKGTPSNISMVVALHEAENDDEIVFARTHDPDRSWRLIGDVIWFKDQDRLIGIGAILTDPDHQIKAHGLIAVPIDNPADFEVLHGKTLNKKQLLLPEDERRTRHYYPTVSTGIQGWKVYTTLHSSDYEDKKKWDFSMAQARLHHNGQDWILIGHIMLLRQEREFLARQAALINTNGDIVYGTEIRVSTDDPSRYRIVKK